LDVVLAAWSVAHGHMPDSQDLHTFTVVAGPARPRGEYSFSSAGPGSPPVTFSLSADLTGFKKLLMSRPVQKSMDGEMASLDSAKKLVECE
jgi:hypothetical protein